jgi:ADP-ribose pyrophosphatase
MSIVYRGRVFDVEVETVALSNGREYSVETVRHRPSVVVMAMPDAEHVLLVRQYRHSIRRETWELPAGSLNAGESAEDAARRECGEEIGMVPGALVRLRRLFPAPGFCDEELIFFLASDLARARPGAYTPDEDEDIQSRSFGVRAAQAMVDSGEIVDLKTAYGLTLVSRRASEVSRKDARAS